MYITFTNPRQLIDTMQKRPKGIDLFAGPGGLSFGLTKAGFEIVAAVEWDKAASRTYRHNIGNHVHQIDVTELPPAEMEKLLINSKIIKSRKEIALISGGPPCPAFSMMGRSKISNLIKTGKWEGSDSRHAFIDDPRVKLFTNFVDYVRYFSPDLFLMENVSGMNSFKQELVGVVKPIIEVIRTEFDRIGYAVKHCTVNASSYGVPQNRKRVIFLGWKKGAKEPEYPTEHRDIVRAREAINDLPPISTRDGTTPLKKQARLPTRGKPGRDFIRWCRTTKPLVANARPPLLHHTRPVNPRDQAIFPNLKSGEYASRVLYKDIAMEDVQKILPEGYRLREFKTIPNRVEGPAWGRQKRTKWIFYDQSKFGDKMRRIRGDQPAPTMVAHLAKDGYMFVHPDEHRTISVREAARFQSFPDCFDFSAGGVNSISDQFRQIGNAVPPLLSEALGREIIKALGVELQ